jgi:hypothetical protein
MQHQPEPTPSELAAVALQLLTKVNMTGADVPQYVAVHNWLTAIKDHQPQKLEDVYAEIETMRRRHKGAGVAHTGPVSAPLAAYRNGPDEEYEVEPAPRE